MKKFLVLPITFALILMALPLRATESESLAERTLKQLAERQKELLFEAEHADEKFDEGSFQSQVEQVCRGYEELLRANPNFAPGYTAYGYLLVKAGMRKQGVVMLLKSNQLDPDQPLVKNLIGNYIAEEGKPLDALPYFMAAIKLAPKEPLYHYQLGTLLFEARDDFLKSGEWRTEAIDHAIHEAFRQAAELAPNNIKYTYRYADSFRDMNPPDWDGALAEWTKLEQRATTDFDRQVMQLQIANAYLHLGKRDLAREEIAKVTDEKLDSQKQKLVAQLDKPAEK